MYHYIDITLKSAKKNREKVLVVQTMKGFLDFLSKKTKKAPRANGLRLLALKLVRLFDIAFFFNFRELCYEYVQYICFDHL